MARFGGEIIGIDVSHPFVGEKEGVTGKNYLALLIVGCMASFAIFSLIVGKGADIDCNSFGRLDQAARQATALCRGRRANRNVSHGVG